MRHLYVVVSLMFLAPAAVLAQMGPEMMGGMGGAAASPMDIDPLWSPDGKSIAFTRTSGQGSVQAGIVQVGTQQDEPKLINNLKPLAWTADSAGLLCGFPGGQSGSPYSGFWMVDRAKPNQINLVARGSDPQAAAYSSDGKKLLLVDLVAGKRHEVLVGDVGAAPALFYSTRGTDKVISAGWTDKSDAIWVLMEVAGKDALEPGAELPKDALKRQSMGGMMGGGMMGPEMMGGGMMPGGMMGPEMMGGGMMGGMAQAQAKKMLFLFALDRSKVTKIGEEIEAVAWNPKQPLIAMRRKVAVKAAAGGGMMGGGMMPGGMMGGGMMPGGMMGPEMMGGGMGMGAAAQTEDYMALRNPAEAPETEERFGYPAIPVEGLGWSSDGKLISGASVKEKRVFGIKSPTGLIYELAINFDDSVKEPSTNVVAFSPDGKRVVYPAATNIRENGEPWVVKGLAIRELDGATPVQLTANKSRAMAGGMMGGMMGPGMMPGGF